MSSSKSALLCAASAITFLIATPATAQQTSTTISIPAQPLGRALQELSRDTGIEIIAPTEIIEGKTSQNVSGPFSPDHALSQMLQESGLVAVKVGEGYVIKRADQQADRETELPTATIVVTGTRIRGSGPVGSPITTLDREAMDASGRATATELMAAVPQNFGGGPNDGTFGVSTRNNADTNKNFGSGINLRGLGSGSTLTLFDGSRPPLGGNWGSFADLSLIPAIAMDRIEILTDGASAIYGSDAVAGVVNIRFRNRFVGQETRLRVATADGDFGEYQLSHLAGFRWAGGHFVIAGDYYHRDRLPGTDRSFFTEDLRPFGGPDLRSNYAAPGTIRAANGQFFGIPAGQDGRNLEASDLNPGVINRTDRKKRTDILPRQDSLSGYASLEQDVTSGLSLFVRGQFGERHFDMHRYVFSPSTLSVPSTNPFYVDPIGTGRPITVYYDQSADFGQEGQEGKSQAYSLTGGFNLALGPWNLEVSGAYGSQRERSTAINIANRGRLTQALASSNISSAFNPFGGGGNNDATVIDSLRGSYETRTHYTVWSSALRLDGPLFNLPAGPARIALGGEYRREHLDYGITANTTSAGLRAIAVPGMPGVRHVSAFYGELLLPVFANNDQFPGRFDLSVAGRTENYSDFGRTTNPKVGALWQPLNGFSLRASYGRSFRAPHFAELVGNANALFQPFYLADPQSPTGQTLVLGLFGYAPDLGPERAATWTAGFDLKPAALSGFSLSATWFNIAYKDRIASANADIFSYLQQRAIYGGLITDNPDVALVASYFADPNFYDPLGITPADIHVIVDGRTLNLSRVRVRGLDFGLAYQSKIHDGVLDLSASGTWLFGMDERVTPEAPATKKVGTLGYPTKLRLKARAGLTQGAYSGSLIANYSRGYLNTTQTPVQHIKANLNFDAMFSAHLGTKGQDFTFSIGATNIFDRDPPYALYPVPGSAMGYDPDQASPVGRKIFVQVKIGW